MRFRPLLGCMGLLVAASGLFAAAGCSGGDEDADAGAPRVRIITSEADGPLEGVVILRGVVDGVERDFEARPLSSEPDTYVAAEAPPGAYHVRTSTGWGMLWSGSGEQGLPILNGSDTLVTAVRMGRPRSLYVGATNPLAGDGHVSHLWGAEWKPASEGQRTPFKPAAITVDPLGEGLVALRFSEEAWQAGHLLRACGLFESGRVSQLIVFGPRQDAEFALPRFSLAMVAPTAPLTVHLLPPPGVKSVSDGRHIRVSLRDVPLPAAYESTSLNGIAAFEGIGSLGHGLLVEVADLGPQAKFLMDQETWRTRGEVHLVGLAAATLARVQLDVGEALLTEVRVRFQGTTRYGLVPLWQDEGKTFLATAPGAQFWLLRRADGQWLEHRADIPTDASVQVIRSEARKPARVKGKVEGGGRGFRVRFTLLLESGERVTGAGLSTSVDSYGLYDATLPPGKYEVQVLRRGGAPGRPRVLARPLAAGSETRVDLLAR